MKRSLFLLFSVLLASPAYASGGGGGGVKGGEEEVFRAILKSPEHRKSILRKAGYSEKQTECFLDLTTDRFERTENLAARMSWLVYPEQVQYYIHQCVMRYPSVQKKG